MFGVFLLETLTFLLDTTSYVRNPLDLPTGILFAGFLAQTVDYVDFHFFFSLLDY